MSDFLTTGWGGTGNRKGERTGNGKEDRDASMGWRLNSFGKFPRPLTCLKALLKLTG